MSRSLLIATVAITITLLCLSATNASILGDAKCELMKGISLGRCNTPLINSNGSAFNCFGDCVCNHGFSSGSCPTTDPNTCICDNKDGLDENELAQRRKDTCGGLIARGVQKSSVSLLCTTVTGTFDFLCTADCTCGHKAKSGKCVQNAYPIDGENFNLCTCEY